MTSWDGTETVVSVAYRIMPTVSAANRGPGQGGSPRREELLERAYGYALTHGLSGMSLRPLAAAVGSSPRVLLFLFGSKDDLVRALLARARADEIEHLNRVQGLAGGGLATATEEIWAWLSADQHRGLLRLWVESYARSLVEPDGPWHGFARSTVHDWLELIAAAQTPAERARPDAPERTALALTVLRGALLDLLATGDTTRCSGVVRRASAGL